MRYAFISDIHGNLHSFELVLADIQKAQVDQIVCLGDVASLGPQPCEVIARLRELQIPIVMGNHDNYLLNPHLTENHLPWLREMELWCLEQLAADDLDFLRTFKSELNLKLDQNTSMLCFHGSPRSNEEFLYPDTTPETLDELFTGQSARLLVGGHTHVQMVSQYKEMTLLNPGSIGMPFEFPRRGKDQHAIKRAEYALVDLTDGRLTVNLHQLPIDFEQLSKTTLDSGMPNPEFWLSTWGT
ncbi:MAG TPA: metallophosphoesterase family protein [Anaerolineales bacterium]|nr:metallophosphoesterase family protein [Anaerolineales bacterium]